MRAGARRITKGFACAALTIACCAPLAAEVRRVVILKLDGVPAEVLEREMARVDPITRRSSLPWMDLVFRAGGTQLANFYVRAISLSAPSWSMLDTGQHLEIHGNAEFDRYTYHIYDYLNFFPFYLGYALSSKVDMQGVEVLDDLGVPLLIDRFPGAYQSFQLYQRGVRWKTLQQSLQQRLKRSPRELLDEWIIGFEVGSSVQEQTERELIAKLADPEVRYLDYFTGDYDHVAHATSDLAAQRLALQGIDAMVGRVWTAIEASPLANETALVVVSDHGMNTEAGVYSQGYDLVKFFNSRAGGGHHVVTDRHPMTEYKLKGLDPFVSEVVTPSDESLYLKGAASQYPTALLDPDGNERASVYLRNSDLNALHVLLNELNRSGIRPDVRKAANAAVLAIIDRHRFQWISTAREVREELAALRRRMDRQGVLIEAQPKKWTREQRNSGLDREARRLNVQLEAWRDQERSYNEYADALAGLVALDAATLDKRRFKAEELIPKRFMGDANTVYDLENYIVGPGAEGLVLAPDGSLDFARSFERVDYFPLLASQSVRNNVQARVGSHPVDFIAMRIPNRSLALPPSDAASEDAVWLYRDAQHQALILARYNAQGKLELRYVTVRGLRQDRAGSVQFEWVEPAQGFPLELFEDPQFAVPASERIRWLNAWHSEIEWMQAVHQTAYSNGIVALDEQFLETGLASDAEGDDRLMRRFTLRKRRAAEADFLIFANNHWNFNVRGFNPGGNHGGLLRMSTHSVLMLAGGAASGIPRNHIVEEPYDSLSFAPTILELMGKSEDARKLPGRPIVELLSKPASTGSTR